MLRCLPKTSRDPVDSMLSRRMNICLRLVRILLCVVSLGVCAVTSHLAWASEYHGRVTFGGLPVPGATITATRDSQKLVAVSDQQGNYSFADLPDGAWKIEVEMQCFSTMDHRVSIAPNAPAGAWELKLLSVDQIMAKAKAVKVETAPVVSAAAAAPASKPDAPKPNDSAAAT